MGAVVVKDRRHVLARELVGGVGDDETRLSHSPVSHHHHFEVLHVFRIAKFSMGAGSIYARRVFLKIVHMQTGSLYYRTRTPEQAIGGGGGG